MFILSKEENVAPALLFHKNSTNVYRSDMKVVAGLRPRCCGRAGERMPIAAMNLLRKIWVSLADNYQATDTLTIFLLLILL